MPYVLFARGLLALLSRARAGAAGQRPAVVGGTARRRSSRRARWRRRARLLVGGCEPGIDRLALEAARRAGGSRVLVLADGLLAPLAVWRRYRHGRVLTLSPYLPEQTHSPPWRGAHAAGTALSEALCLFDPETSPREWPGYAAAHAHGLPTLLWSSWCTSSDAWLADGAAPLAMRTRPVASWPKPPLGLDAAPARPTRCANRSRTTRSTNPRTMPTPTQRSTRCGVQAPCRPRLARRMRRPTWPDEEQ